MGPSAGSDRFDLLRLTDPHILPLPAGDLLKALFLLLGDLRLAGLVGFFEGVPVPLTS